MRATSIPPALFFHFARNNSIAICVVWVYTSWMKFSATTARLLCNGEYFLLDRLCVYIKGGSSSSKISTYFFYKT